MNRAAACAIVALVAVAAALPFTLQMHRNAAGSALDDRGLATGSRGRNVGQPGEFSRPEAAPVAVIRFGMDAQTYDAQVAAGVLPAYGTFWVGWWNLQYGWKDTDALLDQMVARNQTPAVHFYYWGDDMSRPCLERGCVSRDGVVKDQAGWQSLAQQLADHLNAHVGSRNVLIILETEFNKGSVATYEPLDGMLAAKAQFFHAALANATVVLAFGNWNHPAWATWDQAAAAADWVGVQALASGGNGVEAAGDLFNETLGAAQELQRMFGKPVMIQDLGVSSYPDADVTQAFALKRFFAGLPDLEAAGVRALVYRSWQDNPSHNTNDHFGEGERHWGLVNWNGPPKPAAQVWVDGVRSAMASLS